MRRYWFHFEKLEKPTVLDLGCGVTARDLTDAESILRELILTKCKNLKIKSVKHDVNFDELEKKHVRPNIGNMALRGVWFPQGF
jgi:hypothetical protein